MSDAHQYFKSLPADPDAVLAEMLVHCRSAAEECFCAGRDGTFDVNKQIYRLAGVKVIKASLDIIDAMKGGKRQSDYRFVYERQADPPPPYVKNGGTTQTGDGGTPPPHVKNGGTTQTGDGGTPPPHEENGGTTQTGDGGTPPPHEENGGTTPMAETADEHGIG